MSASILVVEGNAITRKIVRVALRYEGYEILEASDGATALRLMEHAVPDLVLQDLVLPDIDGLELVGLLRAVAGASRVPILAFSGLTSGLDEARISEVGFDDFITKPIEPSLMVRIVKAHLLSAERSTTSYGRGRRLLLVDDDAVQRKLTRIRLAQLGFEVTTAADGIEALECARLAPPDVIVTDALMPRLDGFGLCDAVRKDPTLARVPLHIVTSSYLEESDRELARAAGANSFMVRTPDLREIIDTLHATFSGARPTRPPTSGDRPSALAAQRAERALQQLDRQVALNAMLGQRCSTLAAEVSVLRGIFTTLVDSRESDGALEEVLASCLDAAGTSRGILYVVGDDGVFTVHAQHGFPPTAAPDLASFFGHPEVLKRALDADVELELPSGDDASDGSAAIAEQIGQPAIVLPLRLRGAALGALVLTAKASVADATDFREFARAIASQVSVALAMERSFSDLAASEKRRRTLMESAEDAIFVGDAGGVLVEVNRAGEQLLGRLRGNILGLRFLDFVAPGSREAARQCLDTLASGGATRGENVFIERPDGARVPIEFSASHVAIGAGIQSLLIVRDVAEREALATQLRQSQKMDAVGQLAGGVAHDFNNLLAVITSYAELVDDGLPPSDPMRDDLGEIKKAALRAATLTRQLLAFSRRQVLQPAVIDLNAVVGDMEKMLRRVIGEDILLSTVRAPALGCVKADCGQIEQIVMNLVVNSRDAMPLGGELAIATANAVVHAGSAGAHLGVPAGSYVTLAVRDTGVGMDAATQAHIFEPFFTTKELGKGTGLGLATVYGIVKQSGGHIMVNSAPSAGTTFRIYLPRVDDSVAAVTPPSFRRARAVSETILLVEDDAAVRTVVARILARKGYAVLVASGAREARLVCAGRTARIDLLLTDVVMPEIRGTELAAELMRMRGTMKVLYMSGYSGTAIVDAASLRAGSGFLQKPFSPDVLTTKVREILDADPAR